MIKFPFFHQNNSSECGITCLRMILRYYGKHFTLSTIREKLCTSKVGNSMYDLIYIAKEFEMEGDGYCLRSLDDFYSLEADTPFICHWNSDHFVIVVEIKKNRITIADPDKGIYKVSDKELEERIFKNDAHESYVLLLSPNERFIGLKADPVINKNQIEFLKSVLRGKFYYFLFILVGIAFGLVFVFLMPFIKKNIFDVGIASGTLDVVKYLLLGQFVLIISQIIFDSVKEWLVLHLSLRLNFQLVHSFLNKMVQLPIIFFDTRRIGDILQRIVDHERIEAFLTTTLLDIIVSVFSLVIFSIILFLFNPLFFYIFIGAMCLYLLWMAFFIKARKKLDWEHFDIKADQQTIIMQLVKGIYDLKLYNASDFLLKRWVKNQQEDIGYHRRFLKTTQLQEKGAWVIFQCSQLIILYLSAKFIIEGKLSIGAMLSIEFMVGQLILPMKTIINSVILGIETKLSLDRVFDVWDTQNEVGKEAAAVSLLSDKSIYFRKCSFRYVGQDELSAIKDLNFRIEEGKTTAIVGCSGSGKSTIMKLILGYYTNYTGEIIVRGYDLKDMDIERWRGLCGVVFQNNYIFNDTIANNITLSDSCDQHRLDEVLRIANLKEFVSGLPQKQNTIIGENGKGLSQGQQQRFFIARAIYRNPDYIFLDEATNALDADNESVIMQNLYRSTKDKTLVIIAHRLSTIRFADKILFFKDGRVVEEGTHDELMERKGEFYELIKKQLK